MVEEMKKAFAEEPRQLNEQRASMEEQRRVYAEANAAWDLEIEEDVKRIAKTSAALTEYCAKCCAKVTNPAKVVGSNKVVRSVEEADSVVVHVVPLKKGVRTYADAVSEPLDGRTEMMSRSEGVAPSIGAAMVKCMRCSEQGHGHWTCFREVHESRLWGRDPKRRRKRWRRSDMSVKVVPETTKSMPSAVNGVDDMVAPLVVVSVVRGCEGKRLGGDNEEVTSKTNERRGIGASGGTVELKEVAFKGTMRGGRGGCGRGGCDRFGSVRT